MNTHSRSVFLKNVAALIAITMTGTSFDFQKYKPLLSFSTLGCPEWPFAKILQFAQRNGYDGLEMRGILKQLDLAKCTEFSSPAEISNTNKLMKDHGLKFADLGSSAALHFSNPDERKKNLGEAKRFIDLAEKLKCPYIRVFPNDIPKDQDRKTTFDLITKGLLELGEYASNTSVTVLMESHGQVVESDDLVTIMKNAEHPHVGLVWDIVNMWSVTKEMPAAVYPKLKKYIRHTHIKDLNIVDGKEQYVLLGKGESPIFEGIDALAKGGYTGYFSFEWEKLWHPEIGDPAVAIADYPKAMRQHFGDV